MNRRGLLAGISTFIVTVAGGTRNVWARGKDADQLKQDTFSIEPIWTAPNGEKIVSVMKWQDELVIATERRTYYMRQR